MVKPFPKEPADGKGPVRVMKKFNAETASTIITFIRGGAFAETAAAAAGISKSTLYEWLRRGRRRGRGPMFQFAEETETAHAQSEVNAIGIIGKAAAAGAWQAAAWHLERKYPERWGRRDQIEHTGPGGISATFRGAAREKLESAIAALDTPGGPTGVDEEEETPE